MIDLHIHTTCSDGQLSVEQLLEKANNAGISVISFCDHNVLGAYQILENMDLGKYRTRIITGIEFDFVFKSKDFHMLGYDYTRHTSEQIEYIKKFCKENNLLITGGSDFHREQKQTLGYGANGTIPITEEYCLKAMHKWI